MSETKLTVIMIAFIVAGIIFFANGMFLSSKAYLSKLIESRENNKEKKQLTKTGKLCGKISMGIGGFTIFCGITAKLFPQIFAVMALIYVVLLIAAFCMITALFKK